MKISIMRISSLILALLMALLIPPKFAAGSSSSHIKGLDLYTLRSTQVSPGKMGHVLIFLSAKCPCSDSHVTELKSLSKEYPQFSFVAVHSNLDEPQDMSLSYFKRINLPFQVLEDKELALAEKYRALKTPHVFVLNRDGQVLYRGGVSDSQTFSRSTRRYLREALSDIVSGQPVKTASTRTLGCVIPRRKNHVW